MPHFDLTGVRESCNALYFTEERLGTSTALVEADETAVGKRKYNRGKRQRQTGTQWVQTALEVHANADGSRSAKRLRASFVKDRTAGTLQSNLRSWVSDDAMIQTDGWKGYSSIEAERHDVVNHSEKFVDYCEGRKISINALEGTHGVWKRKARIINLFVGHPSKQADSLQLKLDELVFRFNNRSHPDLFLAFLAILLARKHSDSSLNLLHLFEKGVKAFVLGATKEL